MAEAISNADGTVTVFTPKCLMCGKSSEVTVKEADLIRWRQGEHIQDVWPEKTPDERELLITGTHPECWDEMFPDDDSLEEEE